VLHDASFGAGDTRLLTRGALGELWDVSGEAPVRLEAAHLDTAMRGATGTSPGGVLAADAGGIVREWDWNGVATGDHDIGSGDITAFETNAADDVIATVHEDGRVRLWDAAWTRIAEIDAGVLNQAPEDGWIARRYDTGFRARFSTDGKTILITGPKNLSAWDRQGRLRWNVDIDPLDESELLVTADRVLAVVCTERGRGASLGGLVSCYDSRVSLWDLDGAPIGRLNPGGERENLVAAVRFNARGNRIATLDEDGVTRLWDAHGNLIEPLPGLALALDFDATQGRLATLSPAGVVQLWQVWDDLQAMIDEAADRLQ
jgi:WD40 repeat protein